MFDKSDTPYSLVDIDIYLKRRTLYYTFNFIIPSLMIAILSIAGFILPPECGEKIGLRKYYFRSFLQLIFRFMYATVTVP